MVSLIPLACVDDLLAVTQCGVDTINMNTTINTLIELKKLQFHIPEPEKKTQMSFPPYWQTKPTMPWDESSRTYGRHCVRGCLPGGHHPLRWEEYIQYKQQGKQGSRNCEKHNGYVEKRKFWLKIFRDCHYLARIPSDKWYADKF